MKKQSIWVFQWRKSVHYWWSYILFSPECKELTSMLDPLLYKWGVPPVVIRCVHWTMQMWVLQTWIKALGLYIVMVYSTGYSDADQRKHQSSASLAFVWGIHRDRWIPRTKGQLRGKCFHLMTSSCQEYFGFSTKRVDPDWLNLLVYYIY